MGLGILDGEHQELRHDAIGAELIDGFSEENNALLEQAIVGQGPANGGTGAVMTGQFGARPGLRKPILPKAESGFRRQHDSFGIVAFVVDGDQLAVLRNVSQR